MRRLCVGLTAGALVAAAATAFSYSSYAKWSSSPVTFYVNPASPDLSSAAVIAGTQFALDVWNTQGRSPFRFQYGGTAHDTATAYDNRNVVILRNASSGGALASTYSWWDGSNRLLDSDIVVWDASATLYTGTSGCTASNGVYLEDVLTHELGHALGLNHSTAADATMYPSTSYCSQAMRTLASDDIAGVQALYGVSSGSPGPEPPPPSPANTSPVVSITSPSDGATFAVGSAVTLAASVIDAEDGNLSYRTRWTANGVPFGGGSVFVWSFTAGTYTIRAEANDNAGLIASSSITITIGSPGNTPPVVSITSPGDGATFAAGSAVTLSASVIDAEDGNLSYRTRWTANGVPFGGGSVFAWGFTAGTYTIRAEATDNAGVVGSSSITITIGSAGNTPPVVSITSPGDGATFAAGSAVILSASVIDAEDGNLSYRTRWTATGIPFGGGSVFVWGFTAGTYTIRAEANDNAGVIASSSITITIVP